MTKKERTTSDKPRSRSASSTSRNVASRPGGAGTLLTVAPPPPHEEIAARAWELYTARGGDHGHDQQDWLEAERQLRQERGLDQ